MLEYVLLGLAAAALALLLTPLAAVVARRVGAVDDPSPRRVHTGRVPRLGGLAVFGAFAGTLGLAYAVDATLLDRLTAEWRVWGLLAGGALIVFACGVADDVWTLGPLPKLCLQMLAGALVFASGRGIEWIANPLTGGVLDIGLLRLPLTLLWIVGVTNAFNLIDGLDGLAVGVGLIASLTLFAVSLTGGRFEISVLAITLAGALAGFLYFNFNPARVFLGDGGSLVTGYVLAVLSIQASQKRTTAVMVLVPVLVLGLPIMDVALAVMRRLMADFHLVGDEKGRRYRLLAGPASVLRPDREHIHHRLLATGLTHRRAVLLLYLVCAGLGGLAFYAWIVEERQTVLVVAVAALVTYKGIRRLYRAAPASARPSRKADGGTPTE